MGKLTDFVMAKKIRELSGEERAKIIRKENERRMAEIREKVRKREQDKEIDKKEEAIQTSSTYIITPSSPKSLKEVILVFSPK